jgi:hypothetical protein
VSVAVVVEVVDTELPKRHSVIGRTCGEVRVRKVDVAAAAVAVVAENDDLLPNLSRDRYQVL